MLPRQLISSLLSHSTGRLSTRSLAPATTSLTRSINSTNRPSASEPSTSTTPAGTTSSRAFKYTPPTKPKTVATRLARDAQFLMQLYPRPDLIFTHGSGVHLFDTKGDSFLDFGSGIAVNALGHGDQDVLNTINIQASKIIHLCNLFHNEHAGELAQDLITPLTTRPGAVQWKSGGKVFLANSGTEANEAAIKFARKFARATYGESNKTKHVILSFKNAFHGRSLGALSATPSPKYQKPFMPLLPGFIHAEYNNTQSFLEAMNEDVCAVMLEPVQGEGGIHPGKLEFLQAVRRKADEIGALVIYDEIQCGLGRTGTFYAHFHYPPTLSPDIITLAKPMANGIPIGATLVTDRVAETIVPGDHGTTFGGNPFSAAVAKTVVSKISAPGFLESVEKLGEVMNKQLHEIASISKGMITEVRGVGLMWGLELRADVQPQRFVDLARERGLLVLTAGCNTVRIVPPLVISEEQVVEGCDIMRDVVKAMAKEMQN